MGKKKLLVSFSGGRTSAYMTWWILNEWADRDKFEIIVVFANTGKEREETLEFINECDNEFEFGVKWVEFVKNDKSAWAAAKHKVVDFKTASRNGEPFEQMMEKYGMVNQGFPHCTRELKQNTIKSYAKSIGWKKYYTAIGIRKDEPQRIDANKARKNRLVYPLALFNPCTKSDINLWWSKQKFDLRIKSYEGNCDLCWKKSNRKIYTILRENPSLGGWWHEMERKFENYIPESRKLSSNVGFPIRMYRNNKSIIELLDESKNDFELASDESKDIDMYKQLSFSEMVDRFDIDLDAQDAGCSESCEVF